MDGSVSHFDLLETARVLEYAAMSADLTALHRELCRLHNDLSAHLVGEAETLERLAPVPRRVVAKGQQRLRRRIDDLLADSTTGSEGGCACLSGVSEIVGALVRQARLERDLFGRHLSEQ